MHILETYPRDELFQIDGETLTEIALGIVHLQERQRIALFLRRDPFERFISALVYVPRERFNTQLRKLFEEILSRTFNGSIAPITRSVRRGAGARSVHHQDRARPHARYDRAEVERAAAGRRAHLGRQDPPGADRKLRRGTGPEAVSALCRRLQDLLP